MEVKSCLIIFCQLFFSLASVFFQLPFVRLKLFLLFFQVSYVLISIQSFVCFSHKSLVM